MIDDHPANDALHPAKPGPHALSFEDWPDGPRLRVASDVTFGGRVEINEVFAA